MSEAKFVIWQSDKNGEWYFQSEATYPPVSRPEGRATKLRRVLHAAESCFINLHKTPPIFVLSFQQVFGMLSLVFY